MKAKFTFMQLNTKYGANHPPYNELLQTQEWQETRDEIVMRDSKKCKMCGCRASDCINGLDLDGKVVFGYAEDIKMEDGRFVTAFIRSVKGDTHLEVHHKYYMNGKMPWEYPTDALITLCNWCHQGVHDTSVIPFYSHTGEALGYTPCHRCNGSGSFPEYSHVQSGVCFRCNGARYEELIEK